MFSYFDKDNIFKFFDIISENIDGKIVLTVIGVATCILIDHPDRITKDIDIWLPLSKIKSMEELEKACKKASITLKKEDNETLGIRLIPEDALDLGKFKENECIECYRSENLTVRIIPPQNMIASYLTRIDEEKLSDCVFMIRKFRLNKEMIKEAIMTISRKEDRTIAMDNLALIEISQAFDRYPFAKIRDRVLKKLLANQSPEGWRDKYVSVVSFLLSKESPSVLLIKKEFDTFKALIEYIREGQPDPTLALHDPAMYRKLRNRVTELICQGWI
ncbi:MAG: hypothetical protein N2202_07995 [Proteobacteria bacterium]|nr:hypothetical protein [Pseudomonadota bacterium]